MTDQITLNTQVPVEGIYDVIVAGAGPAGICAALAAARQGATVALIERYGVVGGNLTAGHVGPVLGTVSPGTMRDELLQLLEIPFNDMIGRTGKAHDFEKAKYLLANILDHPNITVYLQSTVFQTIQTGNTLQGLILATNQGPLAIKAHVTIDATGDGIVAHLSGAPTEKGREQDHLMQPVTLEYTISGLDESQAITCIGDVDNVEFNGQPFLEWCRQQAAQGKIPENLAAVRLHPTVRPGSRQVNTTQVNRVDITQIKQIFPADLQLRQQIEQLTQFLRQNLPGYQNATITASGTTTGVRETRRVIGDYILTDTDIVEGRKFTDAIVHQAEFLVDIHNPTGPGQADPEIQYARPYDIPYRSLLPKGIDCLLTAGRCISGTHRAHASYRVMSICMAIGQAAGTAAALAAKSHITPRQLPVNQLQKALTDQGVKLFD